MHVILPNHVLRVVEMVVMYNRQPFILCDYQNVQRYQKDVTAHVGT